MPSNTDSGFFQHCPLCKFSTSNSFNWNVHLATTKHRAKCQGLTCFECGAIYESKGQLTRHIKNTHLKREQRIRTYLDDVQATQSEEETSSTINKAQAEESAAGVEVPERKRESEELAHGRVSIQETSTETVYSYEPPEKEQVALRSIHSGMTSQIVKPLIYRKIRPIVRPKQKKA